MTDFKKMFKSQTGPPLGIKNVKVFRISPLSAAILRTFSKWGGGSQGVFWGGQSRDMFRGGPVKKITLNKEDKLIIRTPSEKLSGLLRRSVSSSGGEVEIRKC